MDYKGTQHVPPVGRLPGHRDGEFGGDLVQQLSVLLPDRNALGAVVGFLGRLRAAGVKVLTARAYSSISALNVAGSMNRSIRIATTIEPWLAPGQRRSARAGSIGTPASSAPQLWQIMPIPMLRWTSPGATSESNSRDDSS
jgi:hypothetical protein